MLKLVVKKKVVRKLENDEHVSLEVNVSLYPFMCFNYSGFSILLNYTSSQEVFRKEIYHGTIMIYDTKTISCTIRPTYYAKTT